MTDSGQTTGDAKGITNMKTTILHLPVELDGNGPEMFTLVILIREYVEDGVNHVQREIRMRCNGCDWGYNSYPFIRLGDVTNIGHRAKYHVEHCPHTGRTLDLDSPEIAFS